VSGLKARPRPLTRSLHSSSHTSSFRTRLQATDTDTSETLIASGFTPDSLFFCSVDLDCTCSRKTEKQSTASLLVQTGHHISASVSPRPFTPLGTRDASRNRFFIFSRERNGFAQKSNQAQVTRSCNATSLPRTVPQPPQRQSKRDSSSLIAPPRLVCQCPKSCTATESPNATSKPSPL
jgi:hypothetical protein